MDIPFGAVDLYWLKQYLPLVLHHRLPQRPSGPGGYGWAKEAFHRLGAVSPSDLRLGARFDADRAVILTRAINDACGNIEKMPVRYITHPGSAWQATTWLRPRMAWPKADRQQTMHSSGPKAATTPEWRLSGRSSCAMVDLR